MTTREQELEEEAELLRQQLTAITGSSQELGVLMALRHGMTERTARMLHILVRRSPGVVSRDTFHSIFYGSHQDGGPDPKIFAVHVTRLRGILKRLKAPGKIETVWNAGYRASPDLTAWVKNLYSSNIPKDQ